MKFHPWRYALPLLILWLAFSLRLYHLDFQSIWWDEGHSIFVASQPIPQIPTLPAMDVHPPAYFILLHLWMTSTGQSEFALRYLSVIFSLLTVALLWRFTAALSQCLAPSPPRLLASPVLASLLATFSPMYVAYAQEVRSYAMITFLALASTFMLWRILLHRPDLSISAVPGEASHSAVGGHSLHFPHGRLPLHPLFHSLFASLSQPSLAGLDAKEPSFFEKPYFRVADFAGWCPFTLYSPTYVSPATSDQLHQPQPGLPQSERVHQPQLASLHRWPDD